MTQYREKTVEIEAWQLTMDNGPELAKMCGGLLVEEIDPQDSTRRYPGINVPTLSGRKRLSITDYLIRNSMGHWDVRSAFAFEGRYEALE